MQAGQRNYVAAKTSQNSRLKRDFLVTTVQFSVTTKLEEDFEESRHDNPEIYHDILKVNAEGIVSRHYVLCRNIKAED